MDPSMGALLPFEEVVSDAGAFAALSQMIRDPASVYNAVLSGYRFLLPLGTSIGLYIIALANRSNERTNLIANGQLSEMRHSV